jgi:hypothetical protein
MGDSPHRQLDTGGSCFSVARFLRARGFIQLQAFVIMNIQIAPFGPQTNNGKAKKADAVSSCLDNVRNCTCTYQFVRYFFAALAID